MPFLAIFAPSLSLLCFSSMYKHTGLPINLMNLTREDLVSIGRAWKDEWVKKGLKSKQICQLGVVPSLSICSNWLNYPCTSTENAVVILKSLLLNHAAVLCLPGMVQMPDTLSHTYTQRGQVYSIIEDKMHNNPFPLSLPFLSNGSKSMRILIGRDALNSGIYQYTWLTIHTYYHNYCEQWG